MKRNSVISLLPIILGFSLLTPVCAQEWSDGWVYIQNVSTGLLLDVKHTVKTPNTAVWPYRLNYSRSQMFRFTGVGVADRFGPDGRYIMAYANTSSASDLYVSVKIPELAIALPEPAAEPAGGGGGAGFSAPQGNRRAGPRGAVVNCCQSTCSVLKTWCRTTALPLPWIRME